MDAKAAGAATAGVVLAALAFRPPAVAWSVLAAAAAAVAAYLVAVPRRLITVCARTWDIGAIVYER